MLCIVATCFVKWHDYYFKDITLFSAMVFNTFSHFFMYFLGFLAGIMIARSTALENLELLKSEKLGAMGGSNTPFLVLPGRDTP